MEYKLINDKNEVIDVTYNEWVRPPEGWHGWKRVKFEKLGDGTVDVSTVFLGLVHNGGVFETMTFSKNPDVDEWQDRCWTWSEAITMHNKMVKKVQNFNKEEDDDHND